jgi:hypothetical protein
MVRIQYMAISIVYPNPTLRSKLEPPFPPLVVQQMPYLLLMMISLLDLFFAQAELANS